MLPSGAFAGPFRTLIFGFASVVWPGNCKSAKARLQATRINILMCDMVSNESFGPRGRLGKKVSNTTGLIYSAPAPESSRLPRLSRLDTEQLACGVHSHRTSYKVFYRGTRGNDPGSRRSISNCRERRVVDLGWTFRLRQDHHLAADERA